MLTTKSVIVSDCHVSRTRVITQKTITVHCATCKHQWAAILPLPMPTDRAITVMRGIVLAGCPNCGAYGDAVRCGPNRVT